ncbi:hypothetical protein EON83_26760 [bacterium]|nr:MAG: hypothetical protein EON83_26760 [bacterium]
MTSSRFDRFYLWFLFVLVVAGAWHWNHNFGPWARAENLWQINDVPQILQGYKATPNLLIDGWKWWHGAWIQQGVEAYRPLSSVLLWLECFAGEKFGFEWVSRFGVCLVGLISWQCVGLAREFTRSRGSMLIAALLAPAARFWLMGGVATPSWLTWFAVHHDLAMISALLGALLWWTRWLRSGKRSDLGLALALFVAGVLFKEFVYIFPAMAFCAALFTYDRSVDIRTALLWVGAMLGFLACMWAFRAHVLPHAYNPPPVTLVHFEQRPFLYWFPSYYKYVLSGDWFLPTVALWLLVSVGASIRWKSAMISPTVRVVYPLGVMAVVLWLGQVFYGLAEGFWYLFEPRTHWGHFIDLAQMLFSLWGLSAIWKYRRQTPSLAVTGVFFLAYAPVWTYLGWHYTLTGWFVRAALWWPLLYQLARLDWLKWPAAEAKVREYFAGVEAAKTPNALGLRDIKSPQSTVD